MFLDFTIIFTFCDYDIASVSVYTHLETFGVILIYVFIIVCCDIVVFTNCLDSNKNSMGNQTHHKLFEWFVLKLKQLKIRRISHTPVAGKNLVRDFFSRRYITYFVISRCISSIVGIIVFIRSVRVKTRIKSRQLESY